MDDMTFFNEEWNIPLNKDQLIRKGSCCALGCSNCPYSKPRRKGNTQLEDENN